MKFNNIIERNTFIKDIPVILLTPKDGLKKHPTVLFYHGWSSDAEKQRFRGYILCSLGYQVIIPCSIYHGTRNPIDYLNTPNAINYFWNVILKNIEEFDIILDEAIKNFEADPDRIGIIGNSMGGFTSAGIFSKNKNIKAVVVLNGSCSWNYYNKIFFERYKNQDWHIGVQEQEKIDALDPLNNIGSIKDRPMLLLHGDSDTIVFVETQKEFYKKALPLYSDKEKLNFIEYHNLNHFVTTNMMEEAASWFDKYL